MLFGLFVLAVAKDVSRVWLVFWFPLGESADRCRRAERKVKRTVRPTGWQEEFGPKAPDAFAPWGLFGGFDGRATPEHVVHDAGGHRLRDSLAVGGVGDLGAFLPAGHETAFDEDAWAA